MKRTESMMQTSSNMRQTQFLL